MKIDEVRKIMEEYGDIIDYWNSITTETNNFDLNKWIKLLNKTQIDNFLKLDINKIKFDELFLVITNLEMLNCKDYVERIECLSKYNISYKINEGVLYACLGSGFFLSDKLFEDVKILQNYPVNKSIWILFTKKSFVDSKYHFEDLKLIMKCIEGKNENISNILELAYNEDSINSDFHLSDMNLLASCKNCYFINLLAMNKVSLQDSLHDRNMKLLSKDSICNIDLFRLMTDSDSVNGKYYKKEIDILSKCKTSNRLEYLSYFINHNFHKYNLRCKFLDLIGNDVKLPLFTFDRNSENYLKYLKFLFNIKEDCLPYYTFLFLNPVFMNSKFRDEDLQILKKLEENQNFPLVVKLLFNRNFLDSKYHELDLEILYNTSINPIKCDTKNYNSICSINSYAIGLALQIAKNPDSISHEFDINYIYELSKLSDVNLEELKAFENIINSGDFRIYIEEFHKKLVDLLKIKKEDSCSNKFLNGLNELLDELKKIKLKEKFNIFSLVSNLKNKKRDKINKIRKTMEEHREFMDEVNFNLDEWIDGLNKTQIDNFLKLDISNFKFEQLFFAITNLEMLSLPDYADRIECLSHLKYYSYLGSGDVEDYLKSGFLCSDNLFEDVKILGNFYLSDLWFLFSQKSFIDSKYHLEDLKLIVKAFNENKTKDIYYLERLASSIDSINSEFHRKDMKLLTETTSDLTLLTALATNKISLTEDPNHYINLCRLTEEKECNKINQILYKLMTDSDSINGKYYKEEIEIISKCKTYEQALYLYYYINPKEYELDLKCKFNKPIMYYSSNYPNFTSGRVDPNYLENLNFLLNIKDGHLEFYTMLFLNPVFMKSKYRDSDIKILKKTEGKMNFIYLYKIMFNDYFMESEYHEQDLKILTSIDLPKEIDYEQYGFCIPKSINERIIHNACIVASNPNNMYHEFDINYLYELSKLPNLAYDEFNNVIKYINNKDETHIIGLASLFVKLVNNNDKIVESTKDYLEELKRIIRNPNKVTKKSLQENNAKKIIRNR